MTSWPRALQPWSPWPAAYVACGNTFRTKPRLWALLHEGPAVDSAPPPGSEVSGSVASPAANSSQKAIPSQAEPAITPAVIGVEMPVSFPAGTRSALPRLTKVAQNFWISFMTCERMPAKWPSSTYRWTSTACWVGSRTMMLRSVGSRTRTRVIYLLRVPLVMDGDPVTPGNGLAASAIPPFCVPCIATMVRDSDTQWERQS